MILFFCIFAYKAFVAYLIHKALDGNCFSVLIDHGLMRKNEASKCVKALKDGLGMNIELYDESKIFLSKLKGITDPETGIDTINFGGTLVIQNLGDANVEYTIQLDTLFNVS